MNLYLAAPFFDAHQNETLNKIEGLLMSLGFTVISPRKSGLILKEMTQQQRELAAPIVYKKNITDIIENTDREAHQFLPPRHETSTQPDIDETLKWVGKAIQGVAIDESDSPDEISRLARECLSFDPPFKGITMDAPDKAEKYILMAAGKPNVMSELPPRGLSFWRAAAIAFMNWRDMQKGMKHLRREG